MKLEHAGAPLHLEPKIDYMNRKVDERHTAQQNHMHQVRIPGVSLHALCWCGYAIMVIQQLYVSRTRICVLLHHAFEAFGVQHMHVDWADTVSVVLLIAMLDINCSICEVRASLQPYCKQHHVDDCL